MEALQRKLLETIEELQRKQVERDAIIADLLRRMEMMERRAGARPAGAEPSVRAEAAPHPVPTPRRGVGGAAPPPGVLPPLGTQTTGPAPSAQAEGAAPRGPAPGQFEVDEEAVQRALERALVQTGALLLDPGTVEIEPRFSYRHG